MFIPTKTGWISSRMVARIEHGPDNDLLLLDERGDVIAVADFNSFDPDRRDGCCHD
jgi:hypothetical protein